MSEPLVSIVMPVFNAERTLHATLRSIVWQSHTHWELILIDDGSTDATLAMAHAAALADQRLRVLAGISNEGLAARLNQAVSLARGQYIARMDADDIAYPTRLAAQVKFMSEHTDCDLTGCAALIFDDAGQVQGKFALRLSHAEICARPWAGFPLPHPTWLGKREWFARFGYSPDYRKTQDQDLLLRSYTTSRFACVPEILLGYRQERRTLQKLLTGRKNFARSILREALRQNAVPAGLAGLVWQGAKAMVDLLTVPTGWDRRLRNESANGISADESAEWHALWVAATIESTMK